MMVDQEISIIANHIPDGTATNVLMVVWEEDDDY